MRVLWIRADLRIRSTRASTIEVVTIHELTTVKFFTLSSLQLGRLEGSYYDFFKSLYSRQREAVGRGSYVPCWVMTPFPFCHDGGRPDSRV